MADFPVNVLHNHPVITSLDQGGLSLGSLSNSAWPSTNLAIYAPMVIEVQIVVRKLFLSGGTGASGNFDLGIYDQSGVRLISTGSTARAGTNQIQEVDVTDLTLGPGAYYLAMVCDNATAGYFRAGTSVQRQQVCGFAQQASAFALPATATFATVANAYIPYFGLSTQVTF